MLCDVVLVVLPSVLNWCCCCVVVVVSVLPSEKVIVLLDDYCKIFSGALGLFFTPQWECQQGYPHQATKLPLTIVAVTTYDSSERVR